MGASIALYLYCNNFTCAQTRPYMSLGGCLLLILLKYGQVNTNETATNAANLTFVFLRLFVKVQVQARF